MREARLGQHGTALVPSTLSARLEAHPDALRAFRSARHRFVDGERIDMGRLAAELGVDRTSLFRWVGNRDQLLSEVLWSLAVPTLDAADRAVTTTGAARIVGVLTRFTADLIEAPYFRVFLTREPSRALRLLTTTDSDVQRRLVAVVATLIDEESSAARFDPAPLSAREVASLLVRISESFSYADLISGEPPDADRARAAFEYVLRPSAPTTPRPSDPAAG
ncbi:QsdR family transcriptional regulator [Curtobacterium sp. MCBD17_035]|uniref:QsdR family transcriptional regulator n=1 Tax=Curtobacterium sp. MCBD17_035 TaxID=2175673 RepID=UPI0015E89720|nr:QsdR family transcriptional regulator [Curtobacterium sp. MCBD17_035]WIB68994.1 QsdR family transcriptional regulator [Curtobacterium sp. MCBD17_035]